MSIRSNSLPLRGDLSPELQDILRRNGMQAHIIRQGDGFQLAVQGHDSPLLTYPISAQQMKAMTDWGTNYANKNAYNTFAALVGNDFYVPRNFVHARNANGRVAMGLHGYRIGVGEYGRMAWDRRGLHPMWGLHDRFFLGWTPRQQAGFHSNGSRPSRRTHQTRRVAEWRLRLLLQGTADSRTASEARRVGRPPDSHHSYGSGSTKAGTSQAI